MEMNVLLRVNRLLHDRKEWQQSSLGHWVWHGGFSSLVLMKSQTIFQNKKYNVFKALSQKHLQHCKATVGSTKNHYVKETKKKKSLLFSLLSWSSSYSRFYFSLLLINSIITVSCKIIVHDSDVEKWRWSEALMCSGRSGTMFPVHDLKEGHKIKQQ